MIVLQGFLLIVVITFSSFADDGDQFTRLINLTKLETWVLQNRSTSLIINNSSFTTAPVINILDQDTAQYQHNALDMALEYNNIDESGYPANLRHSEYSIAIAANYKVHANNEPSTNVFLDTASSRIAILAWYNYNRAKFIRVKTIFNPVALQINSSIYGQGYYSTLKDYVPMIDPYLPDEFKKDRVIHQQQQATLLGNLSLKCGVGRKIDMSPAYKVFQLEKRLLHNNVSSHPLSDHSRKALSQFFARKNSYKLNEYEQLQAFKKELDTILAKDSAIDILRLRYISAMECKKIILRNGPPIYSRAQFSLFSTSRPGYTLHRSEIDYPFDILDEYPDTTYITNTFTYKHRLGIDFSWTKPLSTNWYFNLAAQRQFFSFDESGNHDPGKNAGLDDILLIQWHLDAGFWPSDWLLINGGMQYIPAWLVVPFQWPYASFLKLQCFIEEYLSIAVSVSFHTAAGPFRQYLNWEDPFSRQTKGVYLSLQANYTF